MIRDLRSASAKERTVEDVTEYSIAKDAKTLVYAVASKKDETNGVYSIVPGNDAAANALLAGKGKYSKITWDSNQRQMAFLSDSRWSRAVQGVFVESQRRAGRGWCRHRRRDSRAATEFSSAAK